MRFLTFACILFFLTNIPIPIFGRDRYDPDGWKGAADYILQAMNTSANPCRNFYEFACGKWTKNTDEKFIRVRERIHFLVIDTLLKAIRRVNMNDPKTPLYSKQLRTFYDQCIIKTSDINQALIGIYNITSLGPLGPMPLLNNGKTDNNWNPYFLMGQIQSLFGTSILFKSWVQISKEECSNVPLLALNWPFTGDRRRMLEMDESFASKLVTIADAMGVKLDEGRAVDRIRQFKEREQKLSRIKLGSQTQGTFHLNELKSKVNKNIDWTALFRGLIPKHIREIWEEKDPKIIFPKPIEYFKMLDQEIVKWTQADLLDYAYLRFFDFYLDDYQITPQVWYEVKEGEEVPMELPDLSKEDNHCYQHILAYAGAAAARVLLDNVGANHGRRFVQAWKSDVELLSESIFAAFRYMIQTADWLRIEDKYAVISKLNEIELFSGIPDWMVNDQGVNSHTPPFDPSLSKYENDLGMYKHKYEWTLRPLLTGQFSALGVPNVEGREHLMDAYMYTEPEPNLEWGAFYIDGAVNIALGLILPPMYNISYPLVVKFGLVGWVLGHEMMHAFDTINVGKRIGNSRPLTSHGLKEFTKRAQCIIRQYSGYCYKKDNFCVQGGQTLNDNIADMEGLKVAYMAYKFATQGQGIEAKLPGLEHLTQDQLFFLSAARAWCGTGQDKRFARGTDEHSPGRPRIELSMMNFPAFAQSFCCQTGAKFAPLQTCDLWGDFLEPNIREKKKGKKKCLFD